MTTPTHTPGPWKATGKGGTHDGGSSVQHPCFCGDITAREQGIVLQGCFLGVMGRTPKEAAANAHLIAAAPELLAMLQRVLHPMASDDDIDEARALLDKLNREGIK